MARSLAKLNDLSLSKRYASVFSGPDGLKVLDDLKEECFDKTTTYVQGFTDGTAFNEGCRTVLLYIQAHIRQGERP